MRQRSCASPSSLARQKSMYWPAASTPRAASMSRVAVGRCRWRAPSPIASALAFAPRLGSSRMSPANEGRPCRLTGQVRHLEHLGAETLVHFVVADAAAPIVARVEPAIAAGLSIGAQISARVKPDRILIFDGAGKR